MAAASGLSIGGNVVVVANPIGTTSPVSSARTAALAQKVAFVKSQKLSCFEWAMKATSAFFSFATTLGCSGFVTVPANTTVSIFRFGKLDGMITTPGIHWVTPCCDTVKHFAGTQTHNSDEMHVIDAAGNPILVRALLEYAIDDSAAFHIATSSNTQVLFNMTEQVVRSTCTKLPLLSDHGPDIRNHISELGEQMRAELQADASVFGVTVQRLVIVEARYAPEIAAQMLMKQQAGAMVAARETIVAGAIHIVRDTLKEFPTMSEAGKERIISSLLVTLTSHQQAAPVVPVS
jgi:hypothetical protein